MPVTSCIITFGRNALTIKNDASFASTDKQAFVNLGDLNSGALGAPPYITYEPDFWLLDGGYKFKPVTSVHTGWWTTSMSNDLTALGDPALVITFDNVYSTQGLTVRGLEYSDDYAAYLTFEYYDSGDVLIRSDEYDLINTWEFATNQPVADFKKIIIIISNTNKPYRYGRITSIDFDELITFAGDEVKSARLVEQIDPLSVTIPIGEIEFTLFSSAGDFSIVQPAGFYESLQYKEPIDVNELIDGEIIFIGRFYLDTWESKNANEAEFRASDAIALLDGIDYFPLIDPVFPATPPDPISDGWTVDSDYLIDHIMDVAGLQYELDASLQNILVRGWLPIGKCRDALQQVCFAIGAYATGARSNVIRILPTPIASSVISFDYTIPTTEKGINSPLVLRPLVTGVEITSHDYLDDGLGNRQLYSAISVPLGSGYTILFDEPHHDYTSFVGLILDSYGSSYVTGEVVASTVTVNGEGYIDSQAIHGVYNTSLPANTKENIIKITNGTMVFAGIGGNVAARVYDYFAQRYLQKTKLFAPRAAVGNSVLIDVQSGRQMGGIIERMETDLAGGFVVQTEIVGVIVPV